MHRVVFLRGEMSRGFRKSTAMLWSAAKRNPSRVLILCVLVFLITAGVMLLFPQSAGPAYRTVLSIEERQWLEDNHDCIKLYYNTDFPPIEFASPKGDFIGLGADVIAAVEQRLGVSFVKVACDDWNLHLRALESGECAIAPTIVRTTEREEYAYFTVPYATVPVVFITTRGITGIMTVQDLAGLNVGVVSGYATEQYLRERKLESFSIVTVWNVKDGLRALSFGEVDVFVENLAVAAWYAETEGLSNLRVAGTTDYYFDWSIGVSRRYPLLFSAVQKALADIPRSELDAMQERWISMETGHGISPETLRLIRAISLFLIALLVCLSLITFFLRRRLNEKVVSLRKAQDEILQQSRRLQHAEKMEALGTLAGGIAHDFNNLLQVIGGYTQLLIARGEGNRELLRIDSASRRASALVSQLLAFSRRSESRRMPVDINAEVEKAAEVLSETIPRMITISTELFPELPTVLGDPVQIEQVLLNLGSNSVDAMPEGGRLMLSTAVSYDLPADCDSVMRTHSKGFVRLTVKDTGSGISADIMERIYDPFFTTKDPGRGTGLGLASAYGVVKKHSGCIVCRSKPGEGTTFEIYLPVSNDEIPPAGERAVKRHEAVAGSETIMVVDDEQAIVHQLEDMLKSLGYEVVTAGSGEEALLYHEKGLRIDLVLLDLNMPGMGGYRCLEKLLEADPDLPVIIVSGHSAHSSDIGEIASRARGFIPKPFRFTELASRVREELDRVTDQTD